LYELLWNGVLRNEGIFGDLMETFFLEGKMGRRIRILMIHLVAWAFLAAMPLCVHAAGVISLPQTGQTTSFAAGDDGAVRAGLEWPAPRFAVSGDCVTDNLTGLIWAKNANLNGAPQTWESAIDLAKGQTLCGRSDWRLPNLNELESLISAAASEPATWLTSQGFTGAQPNPYWTSTTYVNQTEMAWTVCLCDGGAGTGPKANSTQVYSLPVAGTTLLPAKIWKTGQTTVYRAGDDGTRQDGVACPSPRFTANTDTSFMDNLTGLIWAPDANVMKTRDPGWDNYGDTDGKVIWQRALDYVAKLNNESYLGHSDWRLPNRKEGFSITDHTRYNPALPAGHPFSNVQAGSYWSSTTLAHDTAYDTTFGTWTGAIGKAVKTAGDSYVWPVRGGGADLPSITTATISAITDTTAASGGNVTSDGGATVSARGVCWGTSANPTTLDGKTTDGTGTGSFTSAITGLSITTSYHVRAYAVNSAGTAYGDDISFTTNLCAIDVQRGGTSYGTIQAAISGGSGTEIKTVARVFQEDILFSNGSDLALNGGYACGIGSITGVTSVHGTITIAGSGAVSLGNVAVY
jgi:hypothetical protein